jgi:ribosome-binding protein aMBF1 (putative translation factor)
LCPQVGESGGIDWSLNCTFHCHPRPPTPPLDQPDDDLHAANLDEPVLARREPGVDAAGRLMRRIVGRGRRLIREARKEAHLTQEELAEKTGTKKSYISRLENGKIDIQISTLFKIFEKGLGKRIGFTMQ